MTRTLEKAEGVSRHYECVLVRSPAGSFGGRRTSTNLYYHASIVGAISSFRIRHRTYALQAERDIPFFGMSRDIKKSTTKDYEKR
jgi:hypothetical protein